MLARLTPIIWILLIVLGNVACQGPLITAGGRSGTCQVNRAGRVKSLFSQIRARQVPANSQPNQNSGPSLSGLSATESALWNKAPQLEMEFDTAKPQWTKKSHQALLQKMRSMGEESKYTPGAA
jgi:hypothetical protein